MSDLPIPTPGDRYWIADIRYEEILELTYVRPVGSSSTKFRPQGLYLFDLGNGSRRIYKGHRVTTSKSAAAAALIKQARDDLRNQERAVKLFQRRLRHAEKSRAERAATLDSVTVKYGALSESGE